MVADKCSELLVATATSDLMGYLELNTPNMVIKPVKTERNFVSLMYIKRSALKL